MGDGQGRARGVGAASKDGALTKRFDVPLLLFGLELFCVLFGLPNETAMEALAMLRRHNCLILFSRRGGTESLRRVAQTWQ